MNEWSAGHLPDALHVELGRFHDPTQVTLPDGPITVMCGHGERAMSEASILRRSGREVSVLAGGPADWAAATGTPLTTR